MPTVASVWIPGGGELVVTASLILERFMGLDTCIMTRLERNPQHAAPGRQVALISYSTTFASS